MAKNKTERVFLRMTKEEKEKLRESAKKARMSLSEYVLTTLNHRPIVVVDDLPKFIVEVIRVGTNINQIAKIANTQKYVNKDLLATMDKDMDVIRTIQTQLNTIIRKMNYHEEKEE
ncbi:hypothetical protein FACS1894133_2500 [Clostridia bacterium]|nr:hypothetical protein FACS1894133_2500 [Clostridia bacterium]